MRDLKHLLKKNRLRRLPFAIRHNRNTLNVYKKLIEAEPTRRRLRVILPLIAVVLGAYPAVNLLLSVKNAQSSVGSSSLPAPARITPLQELENARSLQLAPGSHPSARFGEGRMQARLPDGGTVVLSNDQNLQERLEKVMR